MILTPNDIANFLYCPLLPEGTGVVYKKQSLFESCIGQAIKQAEQTALLKDSTITSKKIITAWDKIWWPACPAHNIDMKTAEELTVKANRYFLDYCKYDLSDFLYPTVAVDVEGQVNVGSSILKAKIDLMKVDLTVSHKNIVLVDFSKQDMTSTDVVFDPGIRATALALSQGKGEVIYYFVVYPNWHTGKLTIKTAVFRPEEMLKTKKMISHVEAALRSGVTYGNRWRCTECKNCKNFKYLTKKDTQ